MAAAVITRRAVNFNALLKVMLYYGTMSSEKAELNKIWYDTQTAGVSNSQKKPQLTQSWPARHPLSKWLRPKQPTPSIIVLFAGLTSTSHLEDKLHEDRCLISPQNTQCLAHSKCAVISRDKNAALTCSENQQKRSTKGLVGKRERAMGLTRFLKGFLILGWCDSS